MELLSSADTVEDAAVVLLDLPADELPWIALHPTAEWVSERLRLGKRPVLWWYPPADLANLERDAPAHSSLSAEPDGPDHES